MNNLKNEIMAEFLDCIEQIEKTEFLFLPKFEKIMAKVDLFQDKVHNETITQLVLILKGNLYNISYPETKVNEAWKNNFIRLSQIISEIEINE